MTKFEVTKEDNVSNGQMSTAREKDQKENLRKCHLFTFAFMQPYQEVNIWAKQQQQQQRNKNRTAHTQKPREMGCQNSAEETKQKSVQQFQ